MMTKKHKSVFRRKKTLGNIQITLVALDIKM